MSYQRLTEIGGSPSYQTDGAWISHGDPRGTLLLPWSYRISIRETHGDRSQSYQTDRARISLAAAREILAARFLFRGSTVSETNRDRISLRHIWVALLMHNPPRVNKNHPVTRRQDSPRTKRRRKRQQDSPRTSGSQAERAREPKDATIQDSQISADVAETDWHRRQGGIFNIHQIVASATARCLKSNPAYLPSSRISRHLHYLPSTEVRRNCSHHISSPQSPNPPVGIQNHCCQNWQLPSAKKSSHDTGKYALLSPIAGSIGSHPSVTSAGCGLGALKNASAAAENEGTVRKVDRR